MDAIAPHLAVQRELPIALPPSRVRTCNFNYCSDHTLYFYHTDMFSLNLLPKHLGGDTWLTPRTRHNTYGTPHMFIFNIFVMLGHVIAHETQGSHMQAQRNDLCKSKSSGGKIYNF